VRKTLGGIDDFYPQLAVPGKRHNPDVRELTPELRAFHELARAAQGAHEVRGLLGRICASVAESLGFERVAISRYFPDEGETITLVAHGVPEEALERLPRNVEEQPLLARALERGGSVFVADVREDSVLPPEVVEAFGIRSVLVAPLITGGHCLGFLAADKGGRPFTLSDDELDLTTTLATLAAVFLEKALALEDLHAVDDLKTQFIALASHELRTPAAVIHGIAQTLHLRGDDLNDEQLHELRKTLNEQTDRMRRLVDQLLDLSRLEADGVRIDPQPLWVRSRVEELLLMVAGDRAGDVSLEIEADLEATVDSGAFDRIVSNLIVNAFRYGAPPIAVSAEKRDRHFRLRVEDSGDGVPEEFIPQLFERFTRSERNRQDKGGAGLGLAIARSYAHAHGGDLLYHDAVPHGACFELVLPRVSNA
jgi:signal transduction histidine kinase